MPQISKIRIVNFNYNDGNRFIPDELYDLSSSESGEALNSLFNLNNGGGKTVLVQLMMQPVHPKAMAGGRRIEDYFVHPGNHSYILLEWNLDGSKEKLLTGISIAASSSNSSDENQRGNTVKYYMFMTHYESYSSYGIANLELSKNENGNYVPASYEYVKERAKTSRGELSCYSSDETKKWTDLLEDYGIFRAEWETVIEPLNKDEGGLSQYFDEAKTSDRLISKFFIPAIEHKIIRAVPKGADSSLETMLINYAKRIKDKEFEIQRRDTNKKLLGDLAVVNEISETLYDLNESLVDYVSEARGFIAALVRRISSVSSEIERINDKIAEQDELINHIKYEEISKAYYVAEEKHEKARIAFEEAKTLFEKAKAEFDAKKREEDILQCAKLYGQITETEAKIKEINKLIEDKESNSEDAERIASLKYSVFVKAQEAEKEQEEKTKALDDNIERESEVVTTCENTKKTADEELGVAKEKYNKAEAKCDAAKDNTDKRIKNLQIDVIRRFDGFYPNEEIEDERRQKTEAKKRQIAAAQEMEEHIGLINQRIETIPEERASIEIENGKLAGSLKTAEDEIAEYDSLYKDVVEICEKYSLEDHAMFSDTMRNAIRRDIAATEADFVTKRRSRDVLNEKKEAAENGYLHILPEIMRYVVSTGLNPMTGEEYICGLLEDKTITNEKAERILSAYPEMAYALLFQTEKDIQRLLSAGNIGWLPAVVPLLTMKQVGQIIDESMESSALLAAYDKEFFVDRTSYVNHINEEIAQTEEKLQLLQTHKEAGEADQKLADRFTYAQDWRAQKESEIASYNERIRDGKLKQHKLDEELDALKVEREGLIERRKECEESIQKADNWLESFAELSVMLSDEVEAFNKLQDESIVLRDAETALRTATDDLHKHITMLNALRNEREGSVSAQKTVQDILHKVENAKFAKIQEGDFLALFSQYNVLVESQNESLARLRDTLGIALKNKKAFEDELVTYPCRKDEYVSAVFSPELLMAAKRQKEQCEQEKDEKQTAFTAENAECKAAESALSQAKEALSEHEGMPLPKGEIGDSFKQRIKNAGAEINTLKVNSAQMDNEKRTLVRINDRASDVLKEYVIETNGKSVLLAERPEEQWQSLKENMLSCKQEYEKKKNALNIKINSVIADYKHIALAEIVGKLEAIVGMLDNVELKGDRLFTVSDSISVMITSIEKINSKIETDLKEIDSDFKYLEDQCYLQGKRVYTDLRMIANSSKAHIYEGKPQIQMLKIDLPEEKEISEEASRVSIRKEIEQGANELKEMLDTADDKQIIKKAKGIVGSEKLLHRFIVRETNIPVKVYKIDLNSSNSSYKTWEDTLKQSSGAEKFVVFFSVVLTLMNYNRAISGVTSKNARSVLILDNPFGKITSAHLLKPMFDIAKHFNVQLICLSDINKSDVTSCFECVIKLVIKPQNLSSFEIMTHEGNEKIEHGYYKIMNGQMSLF